MRKLVILLMTLMFTIAPLNIARAENNNLPSEVDPQIVQYCPIWGTNHMALNTFEYRAIHFTYEDDYYETQCTQYRCRCGATVCYSNDLGFGFYLYQWTDHSSGIPGTIFGTQWIEPVGQIIPTSLDYPPHWDGCY